MNEEKRCDEIYVERTAKRGERCVLDRREIEDAGVVDEDVGRSVK